MDAEQMTRVRCYYQINYTTADGASVLRTEFVETFDEAVRIAKETGKSSGYKRAKIYQVSEVWRLEPRQGVPHA